MLEFFKHLQNAIAFTQLQKHQRKLVFYSEHNNYWVHLEGLVLELLAKSEISICYLSSDADDAGLQLQHPNYRSYQIGEGWVRSWLFENIDAEVMVMTMPDLHQYQLKRSKHDVHYVYVFHSLVSTQMIYREAAFDYYDSIFCVGPHHLKEIRAWESSKNLPAKNLLEHGYGRLDAIIEESERKPEKERSGDTSQHVLIATSWGPEGVIESGIAELMVDKLIEQGFRVTLRPHPQSIKLAQSRINVILDKYSGSQLFHYENSVAGQASLHDSDLMISDWSGAALDYAFGLEKPVVFIDVPRKVNNPNYQDIDEIPIEVSIREKIGVVVNPNEVSSLPDIIKNLLENHHSFDFQRLRQQYVFNVGLSAEIGVQHLLTLLDAGKR